MAPEIIGLKIRVPEKVTHTTRTCQSCKIILKQRFKIKFCSNHCQHAYQYKLFVEKWKAGFVQGNVGINSKIMSAHIRRYLLEKNENKCSQCGWGERHALTGNVPLEIDHIDGNSENNIEENLRLLCPNCHSLTPYFRNLNRGKGRKWRINKKS